MKNKGFTLVELLAVIVVLSIIALIGYSTIGSVISSSQESSNKLTIKNYAKAVDQAIFLSEMNNQAIDLTSSEWLGENVKFEKSTVSCETVEYNKTTSLYGCQVNDSTEKYCYSKDTATVCSKDKLSKIYGNSVQNGTPTPTNPVEIQSVGIKTKNLVNISDFQATQTNNYFASLRITNAEVLNSVQQALENGPISVSFNIGGENIESFIKGIVIYYITTSGTTSYIDRSYSSDITNITKPSAMQNISIIELRARSDSSELKGTVISFSNIQIEEGSTATSYEPYGYKIPITTSNGSTSQTTNVYLKEPLRKIGEYADYLNLETGKVTRNIKEIVLNGSETWNTISSNAPYKITLTDRESVVSDNLRIMSTHFPNVANSASWVNYNSMISVTTSYPKDIVFRYTGVSNLEAFKTYLNTNKPRLLYALASPTEETITVPTLSSLDGELTFTVGTTIQPSKLIYKYKN